MNGLAKKRKNGRLNRKRKRKSELSYKLLQRPTSKQATIYFYFIYQSLSISMLITKLINIFGIINIIRHLSHHRWDNMRLNIHINAFSCLDSTVKALALDTEIYIRKDSLKVSLNTFVLNIIKIKRLIASILWFHNICLCCVHVNSAFIKAYTYIHIHIFKKHAFIYIY